MGDNEGTTEGVEQNWHQESFEKKTIASYLCDVKFRRFMKHLLPQEIWQKELCIICFHVIL